MELIRFLAAKYKLDARLPDGRRLETDTLVDAEYTLKLNGAEFFRKILGNGLTIEHDDNSGDGFLFVTIENNELTFVGKAQQRLVVEDCHGQRFNIKLRPEIIYIED